MLETHKHFSHIYLTKSDCPLSRQQDGMRDKSWVERSRFSCFHGLEANMLNGCQCVWPDEREAHTPLAVSPALFPAIPLPFPAVSKATCKTASQLRVAAWNVWPEEDFWHSPLSNVNICVSIDYYLSADALTSHIKSPFMFSFKNDVCTRTLTHQIC